MALVGPSGSGKTYTALAIARHLTGPVALIDTERGSASKYAGDPMLPEFDVLELESFSPQQYIDAIAEAARAGYGTLIIDSLSHAWVGKGGALELLDVATARSGNHNEFNAWGEVTPLQNAMVDAILRAPMHVIVTMRVKTAYVVEANERGKQVPKKVGLQPVQRAGLEYEFDVVGDMTPDNMLLVGKTRCSPLAGQVFPRPGREVAEILNRWLEAGSPADVVQRDVRPENREAAPPPPPAAPPPSPAPMSPPAPDPLPSAEGRDGEFTPNDRANVAKLAPEWAAVPTEDEARKLWTKTIAAGGGRNATKAYIAWAKEAKAAALVRLGAVTGPTIAVAQNRAGAVIAMAPRAGGAR